jgi:tRNA-specific 2-thiouridylase
VTRAEVKLRYGGPGQETSVAAVGGDAVELRLDEPAYGVAPGQAAVLYEDGVVVGAGLVAAAT